jgi:TATA-binding protein-associated factor Taf7
MATTTLFVNQLPFSATNEDIAKHFAKAAGTPASELVSSVRRIVKDGKFNGTAFIDVQGWEAVDRGVNLHQKPFKAADGSSRRINVREAVSKTQLQVISERSKGKDLAKTATPFGGKPKAAPVYSDEEDEDDDAILDELSDASDDDGGEDVDGEEDEEEEEDDDDDEEDDEEDDEDDAATVTASKQAAKQAALGKSRTGEVIVGEMDPQRHRKAVEDEMLRKRRELSEMTVTCKDCAEDFVFSIAEQVPPAPPHLSSSLDLT